MKMSWVTIDRFCQEETEVNEDIRHDLERNGKACDPRQRPWRRLMLFKTHLEKIHQS